VEIDGPQTIEEERLTDMGIYICDATDLAKQCEAPFKLLVLKTNNDYFI